MSTEVAPPAAGALAIIVVIYVASTSWLSVLANGAPTTRECYYGSSSGRKTPLTTFIVSTKHFYFDSSSGAENSSQGWSYTTSYMCYGCRMPCGFVEARYNFHDVQIQLKRYIYSCLMRFPREQ